MSVVVVEVRIAPEKGVNMLAQLMPGLECGTRAGMNPFPRDSDRQGVYRILWIRETPNPRLVCHCTQYRLVWEGFLALTSSSLIMVMKGTNSSGVRRSTLSFAFFSVAVGGRIVAPLHAACHLA